MPVDHQASEESRILIQTYNLIDQMFEWMRDQAAGLTITNEVSNETEEIQRSNFQHSNFSVKKDLWIQAQASEQIQRLQRLNPPEVVEEIRRQLK